MAKSIYDYYKPQEVFEKAKECIKRNFGLDLTLIEQLRLKEYVIPVLEELDQISRGSLENFNPFVEVEARFMMDYYGLPSALGSVEISNPGPEFRVFMKKGKWAISEEFKQYLKLKQQKYHLP